MKAEQVDQALRARFLTEHHRLVFWTDPDAEFAEYIARGLPAELAHVRVLDLSKQGGLAAKLLLEREAPASPFLVYRPFSRPPADLDWLLDIELYSAEFHADLASIWLAELGLRSLHLREHLRDRSVFLANQERRKRLRRLIAADDTEATLDLKMMAVLTDSALPNLPSVLRALCHVHLEDGRFDLSAPPELLKTFDKMGLSPAFWLLVERDFGRSRDKTDLPGLLRQLFVSELLRTVSDLSKADEAALAPLRHFELPPAGSLNAVVCLTQWRDSSAQAESYDAVAAAIAAELKLKEILGGLSPRAISTAFTFWEAEPRVASLLKSRVVDEAATIQVAEIVGIAAARKAGHWLAGPTRELGAERAALRDAYDAIVAAAELFALRAAWQHRLFFETPTALLSAYCAELYRFDQLYRRFCLKAAAARGQGWDLLKGLAAEVERVYDQGFLQPLGLEWGRLLDAGFLGSWDCPELPPQHRFYHNNIRPHLAHSARRRAFVIISDALRYEAAQQLQEALQGRYRMDATLKPMLGVLPSVTSLGMASLLPHQELSYQDNGGLLVDGKAVEGTDARDRQLATVEGMACQATALRGLKLGEAREFTDGKRVVYIYHNVIDARGDSASTESETFDAVELCITELVELVQICINKLNASTVWVTADHGFLYQESAPDSTNRSVLTHKPPQAVKTKKRYLMGRNLGVAPEAHHGSTRVTAHTVGNMEFWLPRGANLFHFTGGARFFHGGAMPQEVVVPLVVVKQLRDKESEASRVEKVGVQLLGNRHRITTPQHRFELIQTEPVGPRRPPITLRAAVYDGGTLVTSVDTVTFDSASENMEDRKRSIRLSLSSGPHDKSKPYRLVLRDAETEAEVSSTPVIIDRSFDDDF